MDIVNKKNRIILSRITRGIFGMLASTMGGLLFYALLDFQP